MSQNVNRRILKEIRDMASTNAKSYSAKATDNDVHKWRATICGPDDTPYAGGVFKLQIRLPEDYPFKPPEVRFNTKIYHCNIDKRGGICLDILKDNWSPALTIEKVLLSIITLLECPNPEDPLEPSIAELMKVDGLKYMQNAKTITEKYAMDDEGSNDSEYSE